MKTHSIRVRKEFLSKDACMEEARKIISDGKISGMSELQLAREIYCHALAFFLCDKILPLHWVKKYADPIDMRDGGDKPMRKVVFAASWMMTGRKK